MPEEKNDFPNMYSPLGDVLSKEDKQKFIQEMMQPVLAVTMNVFLTCGIENYIELSAVNDLTGQHYILTFQKEESYQKRLKIPEQAPEIIF